MSYKPHPTSPALRRSRRLRRASRPDNLLEKLFGRAQSRVLKLFLHYPQLVLGVGEISKKAGLKRRESQSALSGLFRSGILRKISHGKKKKKSRK